jgi:hypothetical protein
MRLIKYLGRNLMICKAMLAGVATFTAMLLSNEVSSAGVECAPGLAVNIYLPKRECPRPPPPPGGKCDNPPCAQKCRTRICEVAEKLLKKDCTPDQNKAARYADIYFFRRPGVLKLDPDTEAQLTTALISHDGITAMDATSELRGGQDRAKRFLGSLVALHVWARAKGSLHAPEAQQLFAALEENQAAVPEAKADLNYMLALKAVEGNDTSGALDRLEAALSTEPQFFNAHVVRVAILVDLAERVAQSEEKCLTAYRKLTNALEVLFEFSPCGLQAAHTAAYLRSRQESPNENVSLLLTELFLATISKQRTAANSKAAKLESLATAKTSCRSFISESIADLNSRF